VSVFVQFYVRSSVLFSAATRPAYATRLAHIRAAVAFLKDPRRLIVYATSSALLTYAYVSLSCALSHKNVIAPFVDIPG
jgi:hypothetical protein